METKRSKLVFVTLISLIFVIFCHKSYADIRIDPRTIKKQQLVFTPNIQAYGWSTGQAPLRMLSVNEGICALTGVSGNFRGGGELVNVFMSNGYYYLKGQTMQDYMWGQAHCVKYKDFGPNYASIKYYEDPAWWGASGIQDATGGSREFKCLGGAYKARFLRGVSGDFERGQSIVPSVLAGIYHYQVSTTPITVYGAQFKAGRNISGTMGCLIGTAAPNMETSITSYKHADFTTSQNTIIHTGYNARSYFCTLVGVRGFFHGGGERVNLWIDPSTKEWLMQGQTMQGYIGMSTWCFKYR